VDDAFDALAPDADADTIQQLAEQMAPGIRRLREQYPSMGDIGAYTTGDEQAARSTVLQAVLELYNPAQVEALRRATLLLQPAEDDG
jgi:hypothetical protein